MEHAAGGPVDETGYLADNGGAGAICLYHRVGNRDGGQQSFGIGM